MILSPNERLIMISLNDMPKYAYDLAKDLDKLDSVIAATLRKMRKAAVS